MESSRIAGFELVRKLGAGRFGTVYLARQAALDRWVAVKVFSRRFGEDPSFVARALAAARTAARLTHHHIVPLHEAGQADGRLFIVMEYVQGYSVAEWLFRKERLPERDVLLVGEYTAQALRHAWEQEGLLHGNLHPGNILVHEDGTIKLADFLPLFDTHGAQTFSDLPGLPEYSPTDATPYACRDRYALGAVLYHLLTGRIPCEPDPGAAERGTAPDPQDLNAFVSDGMAWLLEKLMLRESAEPCPEWGRVLADLANVQEGKRPLKPWPREGASVVARGTRRKAAGQAPRASSTPDGRKGRRAVQAILALAAVLALAAAVWPVARLRNRSRSPEPRDHPPAVPEDAVQPFPAAPLQEDPPPEASRLDSSPSAPADEPWPDEKEPELPASFWDESTAEDRDAGAANAKSAERVAALMDYSRELAAWINLLHQREYDEVRLALERYHPPHSSLSPVHERDRGRINLFLELLEMPAARPEFLRGQTARFIPDLEGVIVAVEGQRVTIETSGPQPERTLLQVPMHRLRDQDLARLLKAIDEDREARHMAVIHLARARFEAADPWIEQAVAAHPENRFLAHWRREWESTLRNVAAGKALDQIAARVEEGRIPEADALMQSARSTYGATDVFQWARREEREDLAATIEGTIVAEQFEEHDARQEDR